MRLLFLLALFFSLCCEHSFAGITSDEYQRASDFFHRDQFNEAIAVLKASLDKDPSQPAVYNLLGVIYLKQNESIQSAIGPFEEAIRIDPNYAEAYFNLASLYAGTANRPELAAEYFRKTLEVDPKYVRAYFGLGWFTLTTEQNPEKAVEYFNKALANFPNFAEAYYGLGLAYVQMGKAPMALQSVSQIRALGREELAAYLESILRGNKVSELEPGDVGNEPALENTSQPSQNMGVSTDVANQSSSEGSNPFQLN